MWAATAILFGTDFPPILNKRIPILTRIFSATLPVVFGASTTRTREEAIDYVTWTPAETAYGGFSFTNSWLQKTNKKWFVKCLWSQKSMIYIYILIYLGLEDVSLKPMDCGVPNFELHGFHHIKQQHVGWLVFCGLVRPESCRYQFCQAAGLTSSVDWLLIPPTMTNKLRCLKHQILRSKRTCRVAVHIYTWPAVYFFFCI